MYKRLSGALLLIISTVFILHGCGSGSGTTAGSQQATASMRLASTFATGQTLQRFTITLDLPPGVTPRIDPSLPADSVNNPAKIKVDLLGAPTIGTTVVAVHYNPALTAGGRSSLKIAVETSAGFTADPELKMQFDIAGAFDPAVEKFLFGGYEFWDTTGAAINLTPELVPTYTYTAF